MNPVAHWRIRQRESAGRSKVTRTARQDFNGIVRVGTAVPEKKTLRRFAFGGVQFFAQHAAAQLDSSGGIAKGTEGEGEKFVRGGGDRRLRCSLRRLSFRSMKGSGGGSDWAIPCCSAMARSAS